MAVGFLLYYGRCVDGLVLPATCALASEQASPTLSTLARLQRLLGYVAAHPDGRKIFRASYQTPPSSPALTQAALPVA